MSNAMMSFNRTKAHLRDSADVRETLLIVLSRETVASADAIKLGVCLLLNFRVACDERGEPLLNGSRLCCMSTACQCSAN